MASRATCVSAFAERPHEDVLYEETGVVTRREQGAEGVAREGEHGLARRPCLDEASSGEVALHWQGYDPFPMHVSQQGILSARFQARRDHVLRSTRLHRRPPVVTPTRPQPSHLLMVGQTIVRRDPRHELHAHERHFGPALHVMLVL